MAKDVTDLKSKRASKKKVGKPSNPEVRLWSSHGTDSIFYQREAQVNFWTVLGGLAMAALLTQLSPLLKEFQASRGYLLLFLVSSLLILANSWVQTSWGSLVMKWPISITSTVITLFQMLFQSIQCLQITHPSGWFAGTSGIILSALIAQFFFSRSGAWQVYPPEMTKRIKQVNAFYGVLLLICLAAAYHLYLSPTPLMETIWGVIAFFLSILALFLQHKNMQVEKKLLGIP